MGDKKIYDFVIVGSGMGGLSSAVILAKNNYSVLVLEKNHQIGGALQVFSRDKCVFDTGVHYVGGLDEGQNLNKMFKYLGIFDSLNMKSLDRDCFDKVRLPNGKSYPYGQGYEKFSSQLIDLFPKEETAILKFCGKIKEMCDFFPLYNLKLNEEDNYIDTPEVLEISAWEFVDSLTENKELREVLLGTGMLYAGDKETTPFYVLALILNSYIQGSYRMIDGGSQISKLLVRELRKHGGEVLKRKEVVKANYNSDRSASSVECEDGSQYFAKNFISNLHPALTITIFGKENFRPAYRDRILKLENTVSSFMVYFSLKEKSFPYINHNIYEHFTDDCWDVVNYTQETWPQALYVCTPSSSKSEEYAESICVMAYMSIDEVKKWEDTFNTRLKPSERDAAYHEFKKMKEEKVMARMESRYPGFREAINNVYSSTPLTYKDYIGTPEGSLYGIMKSFRNPIATSINTRTRIPNLYLTGQNIIFHGILGATIGAFVTCFNFIDPENTIQNINAHDNKF
mgnify:CR=1 FL=1|jgi:all-trans-retinol 13,14-reductase|tara:strand:+ start:18659 stop:20197 length:1539 start_codon:yes stop_codon:yes gene_type:complete